MQEVKSLAPRAFSLGYRLDQPLYDCFYLALAEAESATLVMDDARVLALARKAGLSRWVRPLAGFARKKR